MAGTARQLKLDEDAGRERDRILKEEAVSRERLDRLEKTRAAARDKAERELKASQAKAERDRRSWADPTPRAPVAARVGGGRVTTEAGRPTARPMVKVETEATPDNLEQYR